MECSNPNCLITESGRMVPCWLCMSHYHLNCSNLKARDADALADPQKFLQWTCPGCRKVNIEFYKMFKESKEEFNKISEEFLRLQTKLSQFGDLFKKYPNLDKFIYNEQRTLQKTRKMTLRSAASQNIPNLVPNGTNTSVPTAGSSSEATNSVNNSTGFVEASSDHLKAPTTPYYDSNPSFNSNLLPTNLTSPKVPDFPRPDLNFAQTLNTGDPNNSSQVLTRPLRVIPPDRSVFISRLASETTVEDIEYYIKTKLQNCNPSIYKFSSSQPRAISSFKITVPDAVFAKLLDSNFWPVNTFVREYVYREKRINAVRLPVSASEIPKN